MSISQTYRRPQRSYGYKSTGTPRWISCAVRSGDCRDGCAFFVGVSTETRISRTWRRHQDQNKIPDRALDRGANSRISDLKGRGECTTHEWA